jgi:hypothetical protein
MTVRALALSLHVNILLLREGEHLLEAFLAPDAGLLHAAERHAEEMLADLVDPDEPGLDRRGGAMRGRDVVGPDRAGEAVFDHVHLSSIFASSTT